MKIKETRPCAAPSGVGARHKHGIGIEPTGHTESRVVEISDKEVPDGAEQVPDDSEVYDWRRD